MPTPQEFQAQDDAFEKQYEEQQVAKQQQEAQAKQPVQGVQRWMAQVGRVSTQQIDAAMSDEPIGKDTPDRAKSPRCRCWLAYGREEHW
jgi:hypothetical protein